MAKGRKTTVTFPNGQVATRTSKSKVYTHAVVVSVTREAEAASFRAIAESLLKQEAEAREASTGEYTQESKPWSFGGEYVTQYLGGMYAGAYTTSSPERQQSIGALRVAMIEQAESHARYAAQYEAKAVATEAGPEMLYGAWSWSSSRALAEKAAKGYSRTAAQPGHRVYVMEVDA